jgi:hypothetical protein
MLAYVLNKQIDGKKILSDIQQLVSKETTDGNDILLFIQIKRINYTTNDLIPKITHQSTNDGGN